MAKKYLNLEEAAAAAGVSMDDLKNLRENGKIRGFADRGTWKFKAEDIEEFVRSRQADSDPEVPLFDEDPDSGGSSLVLGSDESGAGSSVIGDEGSSVVKTGEDALGEQATVIRGNVEEASPTGATSDSDVRLILDESLTAGDSEADVDILSDSDSDVRLVEDSGPSLGGESGADSDSDVQLIAPEDSSDSDVQLVGPPEADSDSDVELVDSESPTDRDVKLAGAAPGPRSDSDVRLVDSGTVRSDSDVKLVPSSSGVTLDADDASVLREDSAVLAQASDSGAEAVVGADAGTDDSSISLPSAGSGIALQRADSGIALEGLDDSGISLSDDSIQLAGDSGIALGKPIDSGLALDEGSEDELNATVPMLKTGGLDVSDGTDLEVPALDDDSEFELEGGEGESGETDTSVILFDEDDFDDRAATVVKKKGPTALDKDFEGETLDFAESEEFGEELEVSEDVVGEDDELDELDVFDAGDEDFEGGFETGESHAEFVVPAGRIAVPVEQEWGVGTFVGLVVCTLLLLICGTMIFDLVRYMWRPAGEDQIGPFLNIFKDLI